MDLSKSLSIFFIVILLIPGVEGTRENDLKYVSHPGNIPLFADFSTPQMEPGETGTLSFTLTNRYILFSLERDYIKFLNNEDVSDELRTAFQKNGYPISNNANLTKIDEEMWEIKDGNIIYATKDTGTELKIYTKSNHFNQNITNVKVTIEIYRYANIHESKNLSRVKKVPYFINSNEQKTYHIWNDIESTETKTDLALKIRSREDTEQGTYFVRFKLAFDYNGTRYEMKSRGYFSDEEWDAATTNTTLDDPGNINITKLGVDGIIPDTTFGVNKPWPRWPLYLLGAFTVFFAALAILTYMYEENTNPNFTRWVHKQQRRFGEYRALMIHEFKKARKREKK